MELKQNTFLGLENPLLDLALASRLRQDYITPAADIVEEDNAWLFRVDLPGVGKDNIDIEVKGAQLVVSAQRHDSSEKMHQGYTYIERVDGNFRRVFTLPESVDRESVDAKIKDGVVEIRVGKLSQIQSRKILVQG